MRRQQRLCAWHCYGLTTSIVTELMASPGAADGSPGSRIGANVAVQVATRLGEPIHVFVDSKDKGRAVARFDEVRGIVGSLPVPVHEISSTLGRPDVKIVDSAREVRAGLIVMGATAWNGPVFVTVVTIVIVVQVALLGCPCMAISGWLRKQHDPSYEPRWSVTVWLYQKYGPAAGIAVFVSVFIIGNTFNILLGQRVRQLALLRALGATV